MENAPQKIDAVRLQNLSYGHKQSAALRAAIELDLFTCISSGISSLHDISGATGLSAVNTERICVACAALGLIEHTKGGYRNAPDVERFLVKNKVTYIGPWLLFNGWDFEKWKGLAAILQSDKPTKVLGLYESLDNEMAKIYHEATYTVGLGAGMLFARDVDLGDRSLILDLGGGSGAYCIAAVQKYPNLNAIVFDFKPVCDAADKFIAQWNLSDKISTHPGDFTCDPLPLGADVMIMASNLPQYNEKVISTVFKKAFDALQAGGEFHVVGETLNNDKTGPIGPALWGLHEALFESEGRAHSEKEVAGYFNHAGFINITIHPFVPGSLTRITAQKL
ncbi:MAG: methyltransferase [Desulfobacterales bacterium]